MKLGCHINGRQLRHKWGDDDRTVLALLFKLYDNPNHERLRIWKQIYRSILASEGYPAAGYPLSAWITQRADLKSGGTRFKAWNDVMKLTISQAEQSYAEEKELIESTAQELRIRLKLNSSIPRRELIPQPMPTTLRTLVTARADEWSSSSFSSSSDEASDLESPCERAKGSRNSKTRARTVKTLKPSIIQSFVYEPTSEQMWKRQEPTAPPKPPHQDAHQCNSGRPAQRAKLQTTDPSTPNSPRQPTLLFRAFLGDHGFKSRQILANKTKTPPSLPPPIDSVAFRDAVGPHLRIEKYLSPFISLTESAERALRLATKGPRPRAFAIFKTNVITQEGKERYGDSCLPYPFLVPAVCRKHDLDLPKGYTGTGEFLVWGSIETRPIAVLNNVQSQDLLDCMMYLGKHEAVGTPAGEKLGPYISSVPDQWKEALAYKLIRNYKVKGYQKGANGDDYDDFIDSIYAVTRGNRAASIFSEYDELPTPRMRPVVEIPVSSRKLEEVEEQNELEEIVWKVVNPKDSRRQISVVVPKDDVKMEESSDDIQAMIDAQLCSDGHDYGLEIDQGSPVRAEPATSPDGFLRELQKHASGPISPPVPPADYSAFRFDPSTKDTVIIDICDEDSDEGADEPRELPQVDLTQEEHVESDQDYEIIASGTRGRGSHRALSIRSRSLSTILSTPFRVEKRGRERFKKVQNR